MDVIERIRQLLDGPGAVPNCHTAIGLRIRFANPALTLHNYPAAWSERYEAENLRYEDPAVRWGLGHSGVTDWDTLRSEDPAGVFPLAASYGLRHGIVVSEGPPETRSIGFFSRPDRQLTSAEIDRAQALVRALHAASEGIEAADEAEHRLLRALALPPFLPDA